MLCAYTCKSCTYMVLLICNKAFTLIVELMVFFQAVQKKPKSKIILAKSTMSLQSLCFIFQGHLVLTLAARTNMVMFVPTPN